MLLILPFLFNAPRVIAWPFPNNDPSPASLPSTNITHSLNRRATALTPGWQQGGCVKGAGPKILAALQTTLTPNSPNHCIAYCTEHHYAYAGVRDGKECWCDDFLGQAALKEDENACNRQCKGQSGEICGGKEATLWFSRDRNAPAQPHQPVTVDLPPLPQEWKPPNRNDRTAQWVYSGCRYDWSASNEQSQAQERPYIARMDGPSIRLSTNNPQVCTELCDSMDFMVAGLKAGVVCTCGNYVIERGLPGGATIALGTINTVCEAPCPRDPTVSCGGWNKLLVYSKRTLEM